MGSARRSISRARRPSRPRLNSFASMDSSSSFLHEENNHEMFSGAASEVIPSSISSMHFPHHFGKFKSRQESFSREGSPLLKSDNDSVRSIDSDKFRFFSSNQIEMAPGGSTLEDAENPVDYNTTWEYSIDKYDQIPEDAVDDESSFYNQPGSNNVYRKLPLPSDYGALDYDRRRRNTGSDRSDLLSLESDTHNEIDMEFFKKYPAIAKFQRFYLAEEDIVIGIAGYSSSLLKTILYYFICISTLGFGYLILRWFPKSRINLMGSKTPLGKADWVVIENEYGDLTITDVTKQRFDDKLSSFLSNNEALNEEPEFDKDTDPIIPSMVSFTYRYINFFYNPVEDIFRTNTNWYDIHWLNVKNTKDGVSQSIQDQRLKIFKSNDLKIEEKTTIQLLSDEVLHPFYVFQVFSVFLWLADDYYYYAFCIFLISLVSIISTLIETKSTIRRLQAISNFSCDVRVWRNEFWKQIASSDLVPGDVFEVDLSLGVVPCDALLLNGECVLNESMLTGESVPVSKVSATQETVTVLPENFTTPLLSRSFLFSGTKILKMKSSNEEPVIAMAVKTGFNTTKGALVRSMLFPKPVGFKFYEDSFKYIGFMTLIAGIGFIYSTYNFIQLGLPKKLMILRALDIITIVVPPALPATLTIGTTFAINRLKKLDIFCISPTRVNVGGKLDVMCFDKTGTLTEDGLDILGVHVANNAKGRREIVFEDIVKTVEELKVEQESSHALNNGKFLLNGMSTCHSLRLIDDELLGDPLDSKMFDFTKWDFKESAETGRSILSNGKSTLSVNKEFDFVSALRRMSVVVSDESGADFIYTKGAPEVMVDICLPESLPSNFDELLHHYTHSGFRVIACAYGELKSTNISREKAESGLTFTGLIVFENKLKPATLGTLAHLKDAAIRTIMCTGDNVLTAISVGIDCGLVESNTDIFIPTFIDDETETSKLQWQDINDSDNLLDSTTLKPLNQDIRKDTNYKLAITGDVFRYLLIELNDTVLTHNILMNCDIFARMSPDEKHELVEQLQKIDYTVGFCGDGANDCGALKAANVGISLSEAEASVAAPFTSRKFDISCVLEVIKEGRSSLVTSFSCFKYMSLYSAIQFISVTIFYKRGTNLGDFQFLYIDLFLILPLAIFMSWSKPYEKLVTKRPTANLVSPKILIPLIYHILVTLIFQLIVWFSVQTESWYQKPIPGGDDEVKSSDNTVLFFFTNFQYILISVLLSVGPPYRESMIKNHPYIFNLIMATLLSIALFFIDTDSFLGDLMQLTNLSKSFYIYILILAGTNLAVMLASEEYLLGKVNYVYKRIFHKQKIGKSKKLFKNLKREFNIVTV